MCEGIKTAQVAVRLLKKKKKQASAPLTGEAGAAREAPNQGAIGGNSLNQTESLSHRFSIFMNIIITSVYRNPARLQCC